MSSLSPTQRLLLLRPGVFTPTVVRGLTNPDGDLTTFQKFNGTFVKDTAIGETGSFRYDPIGAGIKSTQQLNVDWSLFQNHVFFNSAQVKVNAAFNKIFDRYPFDGTRKETELFFDQMTGFERYVYDNLPKNKGYLYFSGSNIGDTTTKGTWITVKDAAGSDFPFLTENPNGTSRLNPLTSSISFQFQIYAIPAANQNQIIFQKINTVSAGQQHGFGCFLSQSASTSQADLTFFVCSGSVNVMSATIALPKGDWQPVTFIWDRTSGVNELRGYLNGKQYSSSSQVTINNLNFATASLFIGTGSNTVSPLFIPETTFSGALDELRYFKKILTLNDIVQYQSKSLYSEPDLTLYYKFNEPSGSVSNIVLDYSGKGMHGTLNSYALNTLKVRNVATSSLFGASPMVDEDERYCPILFPDQPDVVLYREDLSTDALAYDAYNPSVITKLVPKHFFVEGQQQDALTTEEGQINTLEYGSEPNTAALGSTQTLLSLLYMWASFFDEIKLFLDAFSTLRHVDYYSTDTVPDSFLKQLGDFYGIDLPPLFIGSEIDQFINGTNITPSIVNSENTLQYLQNQVWKRLLININDILKSKGTIHSIKSLLRAIGIEGDNIFRFKEYGGPTRRTFVGLRESRNEIGTALNFRNGGYFKTPFLSGSRIEPGYPLPVGTFITDPVTGHNIGTTNVNDGLFTSGSWTYEAIYSFPGQATTSSVQSLVRLMSSGSSNVENVLATLQYVSGSGLNLYVRPTSTTTVPVLTMSLAQPNIINGQNWNISFGRTRADAISQISSSYFLRVGRNNLGSIVEEYVTSSYYFDNGGTDNLWQQITTSNRSGSFIAIGSGSINIANNTSFVNDKPLQLFDGRVSQIRWWSKDLTLDEWREHVRDYRSRGVKDPRINFNFENFRSGSFQKLRGDWSTDQIELKTNITGEISLLDFSQHNLSATGSLFPATSSVILPERFYYSFISPNFDEAVTNEKVRVRSYQNLENVLNDEAQYSQEAPVYEIQQEQTPEDNGKFSIDFSIVDSLNQDMIEMFSSLDIFNNILGDPNMMFSPDYPDLETLQDIYFNRLTQQINIKGFFDFYTWFNTNVGKFIEQLIPRKTKFNGINYVIQSHMLERPKVEYHFEDQYIGENNRNRQKEVLLLQLFTGLLRKY